MTDTLTEYKRMVDKLENVNDHAGELIEQITDLCVRFVELQETIMKEIEKELKP